MVDKAELAVVVTGPYPVEEGTVDLYTKGKAWRPVDSDLSLKTAGLQIEHNGWFVNEQLVLDDVTWDATVDSEDSVTGCHTGRLGGRPGSHGDDQGGRHPFRLPTR